MPQCSGKNEYWRQIATAAKTSRKKSSLHKSCFTRWNMLSFLEMKLLWNIMVACSPVNFGAGSSISFWQQIILQLSTHSVLQSFQALTLKLCPKQRIANFVSKDLKGWWLQTVQNTRGSAVSPRMPIIQKLQPQQLQTSAETNVNEAQAGILSSPRHNQDLNRLWIVPGEGGGESYRG